MSTLRHKLSLTSLALILCAFVSLMLQQQQNFVTACSSRTISKPRPSSSMSAATPPTITTTTATTTTSTTTTTPRPNIQFPTYPCPSDFNQFYCLNSGTCFVVKIGDSIMYNCECANGYVGQRCFFKEQDGSLQPELPRPMLESASIASGATCALLFMLFICLTLYLRYDQRSKTVDGPSGCCDDEEDVCFASSYNKCRYCNDELCCGDAPSTATVTFEQLQQYGRVGASSVGPIMLLRQHIETFPMSLAIKRSTKW